VNALNLSDVQRGVLQAVFEAKARAIAAGIRNPELVAGRELVAAMEGSALVREYARGRVPGMSAFGMPVIENQYKGMGFEVAEGSP